MNVLMSVSNIGILTFGVQFVSADQTSVLVYIMTIIVTVLAHFMLNEKKLS
jgi:drug/metabolite transporter (DMT)-like permease